MMDDTGMKEGCGERSLTRLEDTEMNDHCFVVSLPLSPKNVRRDMSMKTRESTIENRINLEN